MDYFALANSPVWVCVGVDTSKHVDNLDMGTDYLYCFINNLQVWNKVETPKHEEIMDTGTDDLYWFSLTSYFIKSVTAPTFFSLAMISELTICGISLVKFLVSTVGLSLYVLFICMVLLSVQRITWKEHCFDILYKAMTI